MVYRKHNILNSEMKPDETEIKTRPKSRTSSLSIKPEDLLREMDLICAYYSAGMDDSFLSEEMSDMLEETMARFSHDKEKAIQHLTQELHQVDAIIDKYDGDKGDLIQILLDINSLYHWLPKSALIWVALRLKVPLSQIYHIGSFYKAFSLVPQGRHLIQVCLGTACQVRNAPRLLDRVMNAIHITPTETDPKQKFTLKTVNCLGCCALGPVMTIDGDHYSNPSSEELESILANYK